MNFCPISLHSSTASQYHKFNHIAMFAILRFRKSQRITYRMSHNLTNSNNKDPLSCAICNHIASQLHFLSHRNLNQLTCDVLTCKYKNRWFWCVLTILWPMWWNLDRSFSHCHFYDLIKTIHLPLHFCDKTLTIH